MSDPNYITIFACFCPERDCWRPYVTLPIAMAEHALEMVTNSNRYQGREMYRIMSVVKDR